MTDHANELRRYSRKIGHPAGDVSSVMLAAADEIERLAARLEAAEKERDWHAERCEDAMNECARLRNKVEQMEKQEPARLVTPTAYRCRYRGAVMWQYGELTEETARLAKEHNHEVQPLYALPGAHPAPSVPDGWLRAIDEAAESECLEQARLNGMGSEREAALMAKLEAAEKERDDLRAKIEQMEKRLRLILEEPENTMSNSKALREMVRQARLALEESK